MQKIHIERAHKSVEKFAKSRKHVQIVGGNFNAEHGPGIGIERLSVGPHTLKESNRKGDWMKQWLTFQKFVAQDTNNRKTPENFYIQNRKVLSSSWITS